MIKQYVDYKMNSYNKILQSTVISSSEKKNAMDDYSRFMSYFKFDEHGRPIITKKVAKRNDEVSQGRCNSFCNR